MPSVELPFEHNKLKVDEDPHNLTQCGLYQLLSAEGKKHVEESKHVLQYLHMLPIDTIGTPKFYPKLTRKMSAISGSLVQQTVTT
ncbi:hypothetical protein ES705_29577 [subsurface metagenome]|nr:hypothetical protein [Methanosarcinales archaeon]